MSSSAVRTGIKAFLAANAPTEDVVDLTAEADELRELLAEAGIQPDAPWLGLQFIGDSELPVSLSATNDKGQYREFGSIVLHVCEIARMGAGDTMVTRGEALRNLFRGSRIGDIVIESVTPMNTGPGSTLEFDAGYVSGTIVAAYYLDVNP